MKKYLQKRKVAAFIILGLGILVAFLLIVSSPSEKKPLISVVAGENSGISAYKTRGGWKEFNINPSSTSTDDTTNKNLTQALAQHYVESVYNLNSENPAGASDALRMPGSGSVDDLLSRALSQELTFPSFTEKDVHVTNNNTSESKLSYMNRLSDTSKKNFGGFSVPITTILDNFFNKNDPSQLGRYVNIIQNQINDLLALEVPSQLESWHLQNLNLWRKKFVTFSLLLDFASDPLKAALASKEIPSIIEEGYNLDRTINTLASKL